MLGVFSEVIVAEPPFSQKLPMRVLAEIYIYIYKLCS